MWAGPRTASLEDDTARPTEAKREEVLPIRWASAPVAGLDPLDARTRYCCNSSQLESTDGNHHLLAASLPRLVPPQRLTSAL